MATGNVTNQLLSNTNIVLNGAVIASLPSGATTYTGQLTGTGNLALTSPSNGGTKLIIGSQILVLPDPNQTETFTLNQGVWTADVTAAILANQGIDLTTNATVELPAGTTTYTGKITGSGVLTLRWQSKYRPQPLR